MAQFHTVALKDVKKETSDTVSLTFDIPSDVMAEFSYKAGQYITIKADINGEDVRRSYSICSAPNNGEDLRVAVKQIADGKMSTLLNASNAGQSVEIMAPTGGFTPNHNTNTIVCFAVGSGITPMMSIIKDTLNNKSSKVILYYGNKTAASTIFSTELAELSDNDRFTMVNVYSQEPGDDILYNGRIDNERAKGLLDRYHDVTSASEYFLCGPEEMIKSIASLLENVRVPKENIHFELFTTPVADAAPKAPSAGAFTGEAQMTIIMDGDEFDFTLAANGDSVLDAAMDAGADAPFSCKGAVCCTCKAKVTEGKVEMDMNYALTDEEVAEGYILTCQSHPASEKVVVDYDVT